jgi:hypothetical protein
MATGTGGTTVNEGKNVKFVFYYIYIMCLVEQC